MISAVALTISGWWILLGLLAYIVLTIVVLAIVLSWFISGT